MFQPRTDTDRRGTIRDRFAELAATLVYGLIVLCTYKYQTAPWGFWRWRGNLSEEVLFLSCMRPRLSVSVRGSFHSRSALENTRFTVAGQELELFTNCGMRLSERGMASYP